MGEKMNLYRIEIGKYSYGSKKSLEGTRQHVRECHLSGS
jgi:hypothetical protein